MKLIIKSIIPIIIVILLVLSAYAIYFVITQEKETLPEVPKFLLPVDNATGVSISTALQWFVGENDANETIRYNVYFGNTTPPPLVSSNQSAASYNPGKLDYNTTYYWQVIAWDSNGSFSEGPIWIFTTKDVESNRPPYTPRNPVPLNNANQVSLQIDLGWIGGDPDDHDSVTYDVFFGTISPPPKVATNQSDTTYEVEDLQYNTKYYWKIVSWDNHGSFTAGPIWSFTTKTETNNDPPPERKHTVFIEEATAGWCVNCPSVASMLHDLYSSGQYRFYYVSLVHDENEKAKQRLNTDYNVYGFPTVYIDGGYDVIVGTKDITTYRNSITSAMSRDVPDIQVSVTAEWNNNTKKFDTTVTVTNYEQNQYTGRLRVYMTEIVSRWYDYNGNPYSYALLDYIIDKDIVVAAGGTISESKIQDPLGADPENLKIFAVVFSSEKNQEYSNPPDANPFDAYYADAVDATEVVEDGTLPPSVGIAYPKRLRINVFGDAKRMTPLRQNTVLIGRTTFIVNASDASGIERVEFLVNGELKETITTAPYEWTVRKFGLIKHLVRSHTITVIAYNNEGKSSSVSLDVIAIFL